MLNARQYERIVVDRYRFPGFRGPAAWCGGLEILPAKDGRIVVIATEVKDPGTHTINVCQHLAYWVCLDFSIDPSNLIWIERYGPARGESKRQPTTYDLVTFEDPSLET
jgi:hypothetical protein